MTKKYPSDKLDKFMLRFPEDDMKQKIKISAEESGRSMNAEIVFRLEESFNANKALKITDLAVFSKLSKAFWYEGHFEPRKDIRLINKFCDLVKQNSEELRRLYFVDNPPEFYVDHEETNPERSLLIWGNLAIEDDVYFFYSYQLKVNLVDLENFLLTIFAEKDIALEVTYQSLTFDEESFLGDLDETRSNLINKKYYSINSKNDLDQYILFIKTGRLSKKQKEMEEMRINRKKITNRINEMPKEKLIELIEFIDNNIPKK